MLLAVVLGGLNFVGTSSDGAPSGNNQQIRDVNQFIAKAVGQLNTDGDKVSNYILKKALTQLEKDPFLETEAFQISVPEKVNSKSDEAVSLQYSGYLQVGSKHLAIINGLEYESKDTIEPQGYMVQKITPEQVFLKTAGNERISLSIEE